MYTLQWVTMYRKGRLSVRRKNETRKRTSQLGRTDETTGPSQLARTDDATESLTVSIQRSLWASAPVASATALGRRLALASFLPLGQNNINIMFQHSNPCFITAVRLDMSEKTCLFKG